ncbi:MAG: SDR family oxidoreductase [Deltaproteobacteria bacterium]|nr:SDR family oxidoreductase [Deltaproteobacteria bacterium]
MLLKDKVALVTGSGKGMGRSIAEKFAEEGCDLIINDLYLDPAQEVAEGIRSLGRDAIAIQADIGNSTEVRGMIETAADKFGRIDILVNCAGGVSGTEGRGNSDTVTEEEWDRVVNLNLKGPFLVTMGVLPYMKKNKYGKIIFISSMGAVNPCVSVIHYHAAKAGVVGLMTNLAFELAPKSIYVNAILPGPVETTFWDALIPQGPARDALFKAIAEKEVPLERIGKPEDIAGPALFLASGLSDYITGQVINVAGGQPLLSHAGTFNIEAYLKSLTEK